MPAASDPNPLTPRLIDVPGRPSSGAADSPPTLYRPEAVAWDEAARLPAEAPELAAEPRANRTAEEFELNPSSRFGAPEDWDQSLRDAPEPERVREAVRRVIAEGKFVGDVARQLGLAPSSVYQWEKRYLDFMSGVGEVNRPEDWHDIHTWTGLPDISSEWKARFLENWDRLLEETHAEAADFHQDPLEIFLHNSMLTGWLFRDGRLDRNTVGGVLVGVLFLVILGAFISTKGWSGGIFQATNSAMVDPQVAIDREIAGAQMVARQFLEADGWEAKAAFVRDPERVRPIMKTWYETHAASPLKEPTFSHAIVNQNLVSLLATFPRDEHDPMFLAVIRENDRYRLDWESSSGYQREAWAELVEKRPTTPFTVRAVVRRSDYYSFAFSDPEKWYSFELKYPSGPVTLYGYAARGSQLGSQLDALLEFDSFAGLVLEAAFLPESRSNNQVRILNIVHRSWIPEELLTDLPAAPAPGPKPAEKPASPAPHP